MASRIFASISRLSSNGCITVNIIKSGHKLGLQFDTISVANNTRALSTSGRVFQEPQKDHHHHVNERHHNEAHHHLPNQCAPISSQLNFIEPSSIPRVPAYRVLNPDGSLNDDLDPTLTDDKIVSMYEQMVQLNAFDKIMFDSQRQGRISFYMTNFGEEAVAFGSAAALDGRDWIFAQYREAGILLQRGMPLKLMLAQCYGNKEDLGKGRQMPIHYGNRSLNFAPISSPLTVQLPQAAGTAYALKQRGEGQIVVTYFGEGAASEGDAHAAMNFAATLDCPIIFFCRNNGYAISTPTNEQYASDGIVNRGLGYGMSSVRVDGNDLFAVYAVTRRARHLCQHESRPCLIEAMTYRVGHHSTSDDSSAYRSADEVRQWEQEVGPLKRVYNYLCAQGLWSEERQTACLKEARANVIEALNWAESIKKLPVSSMFDDVYDELPDSLRRQRDELKEHLEKYGKHYPLAEHEGI
uniref:2-oxoisovalerate dehydrogenase subunit alpha n=1 Tax=Aceria tosichella TaxID=561515 RepID=A0A6G1SA04_9ACAR